MTKEADMNRCICIKERELESAQLVSAFIPQNLSSDNHPDGASAPPPLSLHEKGDNSFYDLPPSTRFTPAPQT